MAEDKFIKLQRVATRPFNVSAQHDHDAERKKEAEAILNDPAKTARLMKVRDSDSPLTVGLCAELDQIEKGESRNDPSPPRPKGMGEQSLDRDRFITRRMREIEIVSEILRLRQNENENTHDDNSR